MDSGLQVLVSSLCQWNLDSEFQTLVRFQAVLIPDSISKIFLHSGFQKQKFPGFRILDSNSDFLHWTTETLATQANRIYFCMN